MQDINDIVTHIKTFIDRCRKNAGLSLNDKTAAQWEKIDFVILKSQLTALGIDENLPQDLKSYHKKAKEILKATDLLRNELGNIEADIKLSTINPKKANIEARELAAKCRILEPLLAEMLNLRTKIHNSTIRLKEELTPHTFITLARKRSSSQNREAFEIGYQYYQIVSGDKKEGSNMVTLDSYFQPISIIEEKLNEIEIPELPSIAENIIQHQINTCLESCITIKFFLNFCSDSFRMELNNINKFKKQLEELRKKDIPEILEATEELSDVLSKMMRDFFFKSYLIKELVKVDTLSQNLKQLLHIFAGSFFEDFTDTINQPASSLNPDVHAKKTSAVFFSGLKGILRMIKLLYGGIIDRKTIDEEVLEEKLAEIIISCPSYYCSQKDNIEKMADFINNYLDSYHKPFPYDDLFAEAKKAIRVYGESVEKYIFNYRIKASSGDNDEKKTSTSQPTSLGRLIGKIEARGTVLKKIQQNMEKK